MASAAHNEWGAHQERGSHALMAPRRSNAGRDRWDHIVACAESMTDMCKRRNLGTAINHSAFDRLLLEPLSKKLTARRGAHYANNTRSQMPVAEGCGASTPTQRIGHPRLLASCTALALRCSWTNMPEGLARHIRLIVRDTNCSTNCDPHWFVRWAHVSAQTVMTEMIGR